MRLAFAPVLCLALTAAAPSPGKAPMSLYDLSLRSLDGKPMPLAMFKGKVVLAVNVASECGYTPQYEGLQKLQAEYAEQGFSVVGFPCNQFGGQEPGTAAAIQTFCTTKFHVTFPMTEKVDVKGPGQSPVYAFLTKDAGEPQWNFHKYLVGKDGQVLKAFPSKVTPESAELKEAVAAALKL